jgi:hypothetical protein
MLGKSKTVQKRRYQILSLMVKGATPNDVLNIMNKGVEWSSHITIKTINNDFEYIRTHPLHDISTAIAKDFNNSVYELKIRELEGMADGFKIDSKVWLTLQELIRKTRVDSLKLQGLMNEKIEHDGKITTVLEVRYEKPIQVDEDE